tara:strand:+ start:563 stop:1897 length:1335 start_codon:yes stop_codon:yes gene_type:complete
MALTKIKADGLTADLIDETKLADNSIDSEHYNDGSIDNAHLADDAVGVAELSATGTASSSTFLRGDNTWATPTDTNTVTTINNNADNRIITGSGTANTLEGEADLTFDGTSLSLANGKGVRTNYIRPTTNGNTNTGGASQQYWKLGDINLNGSEAAEITLLGANGYSSGNTEVYGKTTIILRGSNGNTLIGSWWVDGGQGAHYSDVRWKYTSGTTYELWVSAGSFNNIAPFVKTTGTFNQTNAAGTSSNTAPTGSTALPQTHYRSVGTINTVEYTTTHTRYLQNIKMDSGKGIDFSATSDASGTGISMDNELFKDYEEGSWTPVIKKYVNGSWVNATMTTAGGISDCYYVKIGDICHFHVGWSGFEVSDSSYCVLGGLPFASAGRGQMVVTYNIAFGNDQNQGGHISAGGDQQVQFYYNGNNWNSWRNNVAGLYLYGDGWYKVA